jgi:hypothetical protein
LFFIITPDQQTVNTLQRNRLQSSNTYSMMAQPVFSFSVQKGNTWTTIYSKVMVHANGKLKNKTARRRVMTFDEVEKLAEECQKKMNEAFKALILSEGFDPPPWNISEEYKKTEGWIERQRWERQQKEE